MLKIALCDDESLFLKRERSVLASFLEQEGIEFKIDKYMSGEALFDSPNGVSEYDIVYLDVCMDVANGIEIAQRIRKLNEKIFIVFVSAYISYSVEGYVVDAIRYILKDSDSFEDNIIESLKYMLLCKHKEEQTYRFNFMEGSIDIALNNILYVESSLHKVLFHTTGIPSKEYSMYGKLDEIDKVLNERGFCRIHKSFLVNLRFIEKIERYQLSLSDGKMLSIAKTRFPDVREAYLMYRGEI